MGFEATAIFRDEARGPRRTIPRATYAAVLGIGVFYIVALWLIVAAWGATEAKEAALAHLAAGDMVVVTGDAYVGAWLGTALRYLTCTSILASVMAFHNVTSRYMHTLGRSRLGRHRAHRLGPAGQALGDPLGRGRSAGRRRRRRAT